MRSRHHAPLATLRRCRAIGHRYLDEHEAPLGLLEDVLANIERSIEAQRAGVAGVANETRRQRLLMSVLRRHHLNPLIRTLRDGRYLRLEERAVDVQQPLATSLIATARRVAESAEACQTQLVAAGLPPSFLDDLLDVADALEDSLAARERHREASAAADPAITKELRRGRHALDAIESAIRLRYAAHPAVVAAWVAARRRNGSVPAAPVNQSETSTLEDICIP